MTFEGCITCKNYQSALGGCNYWGTKTIPRGVLDSYPTGEIDLNGDEIQPKYDKKYIDKNGECHGYEYTDTIKV